MAEKLVLEDISTGASNDIQRATSIARSMVTRYGMSDRLGPLVYGSEHNSDEVFLGRDFNSQQNYSESTATVIDEEIKRIVCEAYNTAERLLTENMNKLHFIASFLFKNEVMDEYQFEAVMNGEAETVEALEKLSEERMLRSKKENEQKAMRNAEEDERQLELERRRINEMHGIVTPPFGNPYTGNGNTPDGKDSGDQNK